MSKTKHEGASAEEPKSKAQRPSRHNRRSGKIKGYHASSKAVGGRMPFWTSLQRDAMCLLDVDQRVNQYGLCEIPAVRVEVDGKRLSYQALFSVMLNSTTVVFDIVKADGDDFKDALRRAYAAQRLAYTFLEEGRVRQDPAFSNVMEITHARCVEVPQDLALFAKQALGRGITDLGGLEAALADWQAGRPLPRGGLLIKPRMLAYALYLHRHIRFDPFTAPVDAHTPVSL